MRRGGIPDKIVAKKPALQLNDVKMIEKRNSVAIVLQYFKNGKRDVKEAYNLLKEEEEGDENAMAIALE